MGVTTQRASSHLLAKVLGERAVSEAKLLTFTLHDSLMLLAPPGWREVELRLVPASGGLRLQELRTQGDGSKAPRPRPELHVDLHEEAARLGEGLTELASLLKGRWQPGSVLIQRPSTQFVDWKLLGTDGSVAWFTRLEAKELGSLLVTDALLNALLGTERAFDELQGQLQRRLGRMKGFAFDHAHGVLRLDWAEASAEVPAQIVGTYLPEIFTWAWGWSDEAQLASTDRVRRICQPELKPDGLAALWRPHFYCDEGFAWALAGHVAVSIGARGLFRGQPPDTNGALIFALLDLPPSAAASATRA